MPPDRAKTACNSCREKKRKCNGHQPCSNCVKSGHDCIYVPNPRKRRRLNALSSNPDDLRESSSASPQELAAINSGVVLTRSLAGAATVSFPVRLCSWNLGSPMLIPNDLVSGSFSITLLTDENLRAMVDTYFQNIHPVYNFLDPEMVNRAVDYVTSEKPSPGHPVECLLLNICALAALIVCGDDERQAFDSSSRISLEYSTTLESPTLDHVVAWLLRVIYLRMTGLPHATWLASCTLMHFIETTKLHIEPSDQTQTSPCGDDYDPELRRRIYGVARLFHMWISYDYGRPPIELRGATCSLPQNSWTSDEIAVWQISNILNPDRQLDPATLEQLLRQTVELRLPHTVQRLKRCNIGLCIYRRIRVAGCSISDGTENKVLDLVDDGCDLAEELVYGESLPWWHILNFPFQALCVLLALDSKESLVRVKRTLLTLLLLVQTYENDAVKETFANACSLFRIHSQRKKDHLDLLVTAEEVLLESEMIDAPSLRAYLYPTEPASPTANPVSTATDFPWDFDQLFSMNMFTNWNWDA